MPVTEFAFLTLRDAHPNLEFLETLMQCQEAQDEWTRHNQPHNIDAASNLSSMYIESHADDPRSLLITAPWDSPDAHGDWIQSRDNQAGMAKLSEYLAPGCDSVLLFHAAAAGREEQIRGAFVPKGEFNVCRISVEAGEKEALHDKYRALEDELRGKAPGERIWAGWRIEKTASTEDLIVLWSKGIADEELDGLMAMSDKKDRRHFRHII